MSDPKATRRQPSESPDSTLISFSATVPPHQKNPLNVRALIEGENVERSAPVPSVAVGSQIGPYQLIARLGEGGMGAVFKARHIKLDKLVALKILPHHLLSRRDALSRFEREMRAVGKLQHPNVVQALDAGEVDGVHYLSMEYFEGKDLQALITANGPMTIAHACEMVRQTALGLAAAHEAGLVHRDIKPSNLFVTKNEGQIKILDMGLARLSEDDVTAALTSSGQCFGTPDYMAPEQWEDVHTCDARTDLYSLGCTLFFLLVGRPPYSNHTHRSAAKKLKGHVYDPAPELQAARFDVPEALVAIYEKLMAKAPQVRFSSARELAVALIPFVSELTKIQQVIPDPRAIPKVSADRPFENATAEAIDGATDYSAITSTWFIGRKPAPAISKSLLLGIAVVVVVGMVLGFFASQSGARTSNSTAVPKKSEAALDRGSQNVSPPASDSTDENSTAPVLTEGWMGWPKEAPKPAVAPFSVEQAKQLQKDWANYLGVHVEYVNSIGMKFRLIPPGEFIMGSSPKVIAAAVKFARGDEHWRNCTESEAPQHKVILSLPIYVGTHEVTQSQYEKLMGTNPSHFSPRGDGSKPLGGLDTKNHPVEMISWQDASRFCAKLSQKEQAEPFFFPVDDVVITRHWKGYHLPTEAEWEFACRAGTLTRYASGDKTEDLSTVAWFKTNSGGRTHSIGESAPNAFGLYDVHGNVEEWVYDSWEPDYYGEFLEKPAINPEGALTEVTQRVVRGGFWQSSESNCRSSARGAYHPTSRTHGLGFRISLTIVGSPGKRP